MKSEPEKQQPSIVVLPVANMSSDKGNGYSSEGLAEEILNLLAKISNLKVIARTRTTLRLTADWQRTTLRLQRSS